MSTRWVSENYFTVLGGHIPFGRGLRPDDVTPGAAPVVVLSHHFWQTRFRGDPKVIGRSLTINRQAATVIGVAAPEFSGQGLQGLP